MLDPATLRHRFPALRREQDGRPVVYFDNPAGTQVPQNTIDGFTHYFERCNANVGGAFVTSRDTGELIATARQAMADFVGADSPREIVFGPNMTTLTFAISRALGDVLQAGDEIVTTRLEHDANVSPWLLLRNRGIVVRFIDIDPATMTLDLASAAGAITDRTRLLAVGYASNAFGTVNEVSRLAQMAHAHGAWVFVDAVHYGPHGPIDVQALDCDLLVCSAYKFFGPHLGILWGRAEILDRLPAYHVRPAGDTSPGKWETGTGSYEAFAGLLGTIDYLRSLTSHAGDQRTQLRAAMDAIRTYERSLTDRLIACLRSVPRLRIFGITDRAGFAHRVPTVSFTLAGHDPGRVAEALGRAGIFSWAGDHYAVEPLERLGLPATNRIGLVHYNLPIEMDRLVEVLERIAS